MADIYKRKVYFCGSDCIESLRTTRINPQFKKLPIDNFYSTAAKNSGPIALLYRKFSSKQLKLPDNYDSSIIFFNCKGDLLRTVQFALKQRVILFEFTNEQVLLILYANGYYFLIDPATAKITQGSIFNEEESKNSNKNRCYGAQLANNSIIILRQKVVGIVNILGVSQWKSCPSIKIHLQNPVFNAKFTQLGELEIIYLSISGTIDFFKLTNWEEQPTSGTIYSNQALKNNLTNLISVVKSQQRLGLIFTDKAVLARVNKGTLFFPFNQFKIQKDDPIAKSQSRSKYRNFYQLGFLQETLYFYDRTRLLFLSLDLPQHQIRHLSITNLLSQKNNTIRLIDEHTFIFRVVQNPIYFSLVDMEDISNKIVPSIDKQKQTEFEHYKQLSKIYDSYIDKQPINLSEVQKLFDIVPTIWKQIMHIATLYIDPGEQLRALKFANFLHNYFKFSQKNYAMEALSKQLKVVNSLRHQYLNRWLTYNQFIDLKMEDRFLRLLLRYNMHFVADMIFKDSKSKQKIFSHWAKCKIQKETEATAFEEIKNRYQQMKVAIGSTYVFTDLARYCLDNKSRDLTNLANQLIQHEPHPARRCIVFLYIFLAKKEPQTVDKLLQYAQQSNSSQAIHLTIQNLRKISQDWLPAKAWLEILPKKPILEYHYIKTLKSSNELQELKQYFTMNGLFVQMSYISLRKEIEKLEVQNTESVIKLISGDYSKVLSSLLDQLQKCNRRNGVDTLRQLKNKKYPITEEDSNSLTKDGQFEVLAEIILKKDNNLPLASRILRKIKSDKVYGLLVRKGKIKDAIQEAFARKNKQKLRQLILKADEPIQNFGKQLLQELQQSK